MEPPVPPAPAAGLCGVCSHARGVTSDRGGSFILCERSRTDRRFARYPRLPMLTCWGFEPRAITPPEENQRA
ncbi:MAG TPA: hypothetical protein VH720_06025 [Candidatus Limnocylindrales bacterium]